MKFLNQMQIPLIIKVYHYSNSFRITENINTIGHRYLTTTYAFKGMLNVEFKVCYYGFQPGSGGSDVPRSQCTHSTRVHYC